MKNYFSITLFLLVFGGQGQAAELIFKNGFENRFLIGGTASGVESTGLKLALESVSGPDEITIDSNGQFFFNLEVMAGHAWSVDLVTLPNDPQQQSCTLTNNAGSALPNGGVDNIELTCQNQLWHWDVMSWEQGGWN